MGHPTAVDMVETNKAETSWVSCHQEATLTAEPTKAGMKNKDWGTRTEMVVKKPRRGLQIRQHLVMLREGPTHISKV